MEKLQQGFPIRRERREISDPLSPPDPVFGYYESCASNQICQRLLANFTTHTAKSIANFRTFKRNDTLETNTSNCCKDMSEKLLKDAYEHPVGDKACDEKFIDDHDEEVEEEEEFHEAEEDKHKTSQESVGDVRVTATNTKDDTSNKALSEMLDEAPKQINEVTSEEKFENQSEDASAESSGKITKEQLEESPAEISVDNLDATNIKVPSEIPEKPTEEKSGTGTVEISATSSSQTAVDCLKEIELKLSDLSLTSNQSQVINDGTVVQCEDEPKSAEKPSEDDRENQIDVSETQPRNTDWADLMSSNVKDTDEGVYSEIPTNKNVIGEETNNEEDQDSEKKELDLDEDVKNPQYIPKKGVFYEHDDRSHDSITKKPITNSVKGTEDTAEIKETSQKKTGNTEKPADNRKGNRRQRTETDRWNHDLFRDEKQKPKSKSELINSYGYDIRQERSSRSTNDTRGIQRGNGVSERPQINQDNQRSRQTRDNRSPRQGQALNRSKDRRSRRPNNRNRQETSGSAPRRDQNRNVKQDSRDSKQEFSDFKPNFQSQQSQPNTTSSKRDYSDSTKERNPRFDNRGRRQDSKDGLITNAIDDKFPPITTVMPPITTWSNKIEDMVKEDAISRESPSRHQSQNTNKSRSSNDYWVNNQASKPAFERSARNLDDNRQQPTTQQYQNRKYNDRDESHKTTQFLNRNQFNDRSNQHNHEWRRANNYNSNYAKSNEFEPIKTQTFENSRLAQTNINRSHYRDQRDAREIINERRMQGQQISQSKVQPLVLNNEQIQQQPQQQRQQAQIHIQSQPQQQQLQTQPHHQQQHHIMQHQQLLQQQLIHQHQSSQHMRQPLMTNHQQPQSQVQISQQTAHQHQSQRQPQTQQITSQTTHSNQRQNIGTSVNDGIQDATRLSDSNSSNSDLINSRPIIKTDAYTSANNATHPHSGQPLQQHSQNHRSIAGQLSQHGQNSAGSHLVSSHLGAASNQAQYYSTSNNSRDSNAAVAALASAYHGYIPSGHSVMDTSRYHMTSQQLSDHGYMTSPGQANDVATASVLHQQGIYADAASAGGTVASSAYLAQAGSTLSPSSNIPVTGAGPPPLAPVSYLQHSQYAPPPYSNPYSQPQHNHAPPQSAHGYPYWTPYI